MNYTDKNTNSTNNVIHNNAVEDTFIYEYDEDSKLLEETFKKILEETIEEEKNDKIKNNEDNNEKNEEKNKKNNKKDKHYSIIEVGFGNGELLKKIIFEKEKNYSKIKKVYGTEINKNAIKKIKKTIEEKKQKKTAKEKKQKQYKNKKNEEKTKKSNENKIKNKIVKIKNTEYTNNIKEKFDFILFNPPYLRESKEDKYLTEYEKKAFIGGKRGVETSIEFLKKLKENKNLKETTKIFLIASSLADTKFLEHNIKLEGYNIIKKAEKKLPFEKLYCYIIEPNLALKYSIKNNYNLEYYDKGKRSIVYLIKKNIEKNNDVDDKKNKIKSKKLYDFKIIKYALKEKNTNLKKEYEILKLLQKTNIKVPKVYEYIEENDEKILIMQYIEGISAKEITDKKEKKLLYKKLLEYAILLDLLKLKKQEFTRPYSNVIISKKNIYLIDFERTQKNKIGNLTQLLDYYRKNNMIKVKEIKKIAEEYNKEIKELTEAKKNEQKQFLKKWYLKIIKMLKI